MGYRDRRTCFRRSPASTARPRPMAACVRWVRLADMGVHAAALATRGRGSLGLVDGRLRAGVRGNAADSRVQIARPDAARLTDTGGFPRMTSDSGQPTNRKPAPD